MISIAYAQEVAADTATEMDVVVGQAPSAGNAFAWNMGLILILVLMFYVLLIRPQQKRFAAHKDMVDALQKGDAVVTAGGLVGTISKLTNYNEVEVDLGGTKVTAVRSTLTVKTDTATAAPVKKEKAEKVKTEKVKADKTKTAKK